MSEPTGDESSYELMLPFVAAESKGGRYDDQAFTAGWCCGHAWGALGSGHSWQGLAYPDLVPQLDLVAMHFGATLTATPQGPDWTFVEITRPPAIQDNRGAP